MGNEWKNLLAKASTEGTLERAKKCLALGTKYVLGAGGMDPTKKLTPTCDCSGFVAWAIGIPRQLPPGTGNWLSTDEYWAGGGPVGDGLFDRVGVADARPGDLYVYPDSGGHQGHIAIISAVSAGKPSKLIHCSKGNWTGHGDAVRETDPSIFSNNPMARIMRVDYDALRALFGLAATVEDKDPRLILAKYVGGAPDPYQYKAFPEAEFLLDHFEIAPNVVAAWLGKTDSRTARLPVRDVLKSMGFEPEADVSHQQDAADPRVYLFLPPPPAAPEPEVVTPAATALRHALLRSDPVLANVAAGALVLKKVGAAVAGVGAVQDGLCHLAKGYPDLFVDTNNGASRGIFGDRTEKAISAFQSAHGLESDGEVGKDTIRALDAALVSFDANGMVDKTRVSASHVTEPALGDFRTQFIAAAVEPARASMRETGVPASVTIAQAILESDWGRSGLSRMAKNYFGIKGKGPAGTTKMETKEFENGAWKTIQDGFRKYDTMEQSFVDHGHLISDRRRSNGELIYGKAMAVKHSPRLFAEALEGVYATDPQYGDKLIALMDRYDLERFDA